MPVPCPSLLAVECLVAPLIKSGIGHAASGAATSVAGDFLGSLASGIRDAVTWIFTNTTSWWLRLPSPDLASQPAITAMRQWLLPVTAAVAVAGMIAAGARMILTRRANPLLDVGTGLATIAAAATLGVAVADLLLQAGDTWSNWALNSSTSGAFGTRMSTLLAMTSAPNVIVIVFGMFAVLMGALQAVLLIFRQAAVIILAAVLPLAAAGATAPLTRSWIRKIISWMLALISYKPAAAAVYAAAFTMIGKGSGLEAIMMGFAMLALSLLAMPVLMRFFTWTTGTISSGSGGGQFFGMAAAGAVAVGALRGSSGGAGGTSASDHAGYLSSRQPPPPTQPDGATTGTAGTGGNPPAAGGGTAHTGPGGASSAGTRAASEPGDTSPAGAAGISTPGGTPIPDGASAAGAAGPGAVAPARTGSAAASNTGAAGAAAAGAATGGAATAAMLAAQGLASGARNVAADATEDGEQR
ncbi:MAG: hypothetical protein JO345_02040 [Streptosporangiaceae bacterium]|nr:hypothetical protein [Streptosporangiaceae bacterium]